jgi:uncharacterized coiled-coil DUF342 family protein
MRKIEFVALFLMIVVLLSGCFWQESAVDKMYQTLENVVDAEKGFEDQQEPLVKLEKNEKDIYEKIISLGSKDQDQIAKLSDEAKEILAKRKERMELEQKSLVSSKKEFEKITPLIDELDDSEVNKKADELSKIMNERYEIHNKLYKLYIQGIKYDSEIYEMFKSKDVTMEQLDDLITKSNETSKLVLETNEKFNQQTNKYNKAKLAFYKKAGLNVKTK